VKVRIILSAAVLAIVAVLPATAAQAATSSADATFTVDVPQAVTISFTDATASFGTVNPGATVTHLADLSYDVDTNAALGFTVAIAETTASPGSTNIFCVSRDGFSGACPSTNSKVFGAGAGPLSSTWRTTAVAGLQSYQDDAKVTIPSGYAAGSYLATVTYTATTN
jgi:hypothetical protein